MRPRVAMLAWTLAIAGVATVALARGTASGNRPPDSGITGKVVPCGLVHERPAPCAGSVAHARVLVRGRATRQTVAGAVADGRGRFRFALRAGSYLVEVRPRRTSAPSAPPVRVTARVAAHRWTTVIVPAGRTAPGRVTLR